MTVINHPGGPKSAKELEIIADQRKRDRFELAKAAMQGLLANPHDDAWALTLYDTAGMAVDMADKLLETLDEENK